MRPDRRYLRRILTVDSIVAASPAEIMSGSPMTFVQRGYRCDSKDTEGHRRAMLRQARHRTPCRPSAVCRARRSRARAAACWRRICVVLFMPPVYAGTCLCRGSLAEARLAACKAAPGIAAARPIHLPRLPPRRRVTRDPMNFIDATHYLDPVAMAPNAS